MSGAKGTTIRFSKEQVEALEDIRYRHAREVHSFADALRALIGRPKWLKESEIKKGIEAFWDTEANASKGN